MIFEKLNNYNLILASASPRRQQLLKELGLKFKIVKKEVNESYPKNLKREQIALYLCELKANAFKNEELDKNTIIIAADTIVWLNEQNLFKPKNYDDAVKILQMLSAKKHEVITGVCLKSLNKIKSFYVSTNVFFKKLNLEEIEYYIKKYKPYDKAGAYGIQEWIGYIGIEKIEGSYFNVVGLPVQRLYEELINLVANLMEL